MTYPKKYDITKLERPVREALELIMSLEASEQPALIARLASHREAKNLRNQLYGLCRLVFGRTGHVELSIFTVALYARLKDIDLDI